MTTPVTGDAALSRVDTTRERELYRYFQPPPPPSSTLSTHQASSPDTTLTALAQLCALRFNAKRAMISMIGRDKQYFIAESTKTLNLNDSSKSEMEDDGLWFGCGTVDKAGRLCEKTVELPPSLGRHPDLFTVKDLTRDERFNELPFVTGPPHFRFYAGTPLTTKRGINIGSLIILDDIVREPLNRDQEQLLGTIAATIMKHMEMASEAEERKKVMRLSLGMNAFVKRKSRLASDDAEPSGNTAASKPPISVNRSPQKKGSQSSSKSNRGLANRTPVSLARFRSVDTTGSPSEADTSQDDSDASKPTKRLDTDHLMTFARAANILCESLSLRESGGVAFLDATSRVRAHDSQSQEQQPERIAKVLSYSTLEAELGTGDQSDLASLESFQPMGEHLLHKLLSQYPRGKMWTFDEDGNLSSSEDDPVSQRQSAKTTDRHRLSRIDKKNHEAILLQKHFPGVRQLLFSGLWDAGSSRWFSGGFAWTKSIRQVFTKETELSYFLAFGNCLMAEVSRLASIASDRQKADFIGSISHEFRSPLHGILASSEFLAETEADAFQTSLVDTISSCGRTLLDTINHILDYSKINSFERNWRNARKPGSRLKQSVDRRVADSDAPPMMNIYATIDVAATTEEVVEGVYAGQIYQDISSTDGPVFSSGSQVEIKDLSGGTRLRKKVGKAKDVDVIIDILHDNYTFTTQPGALKRVIMNIFGNALKYTERGSIVVKLALDPADDTRDAAADERTLEITVTDTGKGISSEYLRTSLFNPFCQEDVLASGTGLGLSIVKSIVTMLGGVIDVKSELGRGTEVTVRLPLARLPGSNVPGSTPSSTATSGSGDESMTVLRTEYQDSKVELRGFHDARTEAVLNECIEAWCGLRIVEPSKTSIAVDLLVVDESELSHVQDGNTLPTVVLCTNASRTHASTRRGTNTIAEFISKPIGPHKLSKAVRTCLERAKRKESGLVPRISVPDRDSPEGPDAVTQLESLTLETASGLSPLEVQSNENISASYSDNARMTIDHGSSTDTSNGATVTGFDGSFFPLQDDAASNDTSDRQQHTQAPKMADLIRRDSGRPALLSRMTEPALKTRSLHSRETWDNYNHEAAFPVHPPDTFDTDGKNAPYGVGVPDSLTASNMALHNGQTPTKPVPASREPKDPGERNEQSPRLLLVDDNKINLRLLETYMKKRKYKFVDSAENGQLAVQAAEAHEHGYDIIFMDISMPVMNGFEATRAIRDIEDARKHNDQSHQITPALIIALTGLASSRDQTEAFTSGVDLFMTKPVSFKEVGKFLDNWEGNGGMKKEDEGSGFKS